MLWHWFLVPVGSCNVIEKVVAKLWGSSIPYPLFFFNFGMMGFHINSVLIHVFNSMLALSGKIHGGILVLVNFEINFLFPKALFLYGQDEFTDEEKSKTVKGYEFVDMDTKNLKMSF